MTTPTLTATLSGGRLFAPGSERIWALGDPDAPDVQFNGIDATGVEWIIADPEGWYSSPPVELGLRDRGGDGAWFGRGAYKPRVVTVNGAFRILARDPDLLDATAARLQDALDPRRDTFLSVTESPAKMLTVRPSAEVTCLPVPGQPRVRTFSFVLTAADPFKYAAGQAGLVSELLVLPDAATQQGLVFDVAGDWDFGGASDQGAGRVTVVNPGSEPVGPLVTFTGPLLAPSIRNVTTGQVLTLNLELGRGDTAVVDMDLRTVRVNGASAYRAKDPRTPFWPLVRGGNDVRFTSPVFSEFATATLAFRPRWK